MNVLELFAGAGGGILGSRLLGHRTVCAVERDPYCREILLRRQEEGFLEPFPVWDDVRTFDGSAWRGVVDIVAAGFPCQPWSQAVAGAARGEKDERNLWPDTIRIIREVAPRFAFLENVVGLTSRSYFWEQILPDLAEAGFSVRWRVVSAADCGAPHERKRIWLLADSGSERLEEWLLESFGQKQPAAARDGDERQGWPPEPDLPRVAHGVPNRMDRIRATGNAQVPIVAATAWRMLAGHLDRE